MRRGLGVARFVEPLAGAGLALWNARLVRVEVCLDQRRCAREPAQGRIVEIGDRDAQAVDLGERGLARGERVGDPAGLSNSQSGSQPGPRIAAWIACASSGETQRKPYL
jgi:hypothetical protein